MWTGGPNRGDWEEFGVNPNAKAHMNDIRKAVVDGEIHLADSLTSLYYMGGMERFGHFTSLGDLNLKMDNHDQDYSDYTRKLDLANSIGSVSYRLGGIQYDREYFCSYPNNVLVMKIKADRPASVGFSLSMDVLQDEYDVEVSDNKYTLTGVIKHGDKRKFQVTILALPYGGSSISGAETLEIHEADSVILILSTATDYKQEFPDYIGIDPAITCTALLKDAESLAYSALKKAHLEDYKELYDRVSLDLGSDPKLNVLPTNERWNRLRNGKQDNGLKEMAFNLGRYLIISSSRPGTLPANLQGKWNTFFTPPWTGNYQANINIQEIY